MDLKRVVKGVFLKRENRFLTVVKIGDRIDFAYLPNPGRLWELLLPGTEVLLVKSSSGSYPYVLFASRKGMEWVILHTHYTNRLIEKLISEERIDFLTGYKVVEREVRVGSSKIDFVLSNGKEKILMEVKTCTLFDGRVAMFPDAVTERGRRHIEELAFAVGDGLGAVCLFVVMSGSVDYFLPAYHIDHKFTEAFTKFKDIVKFEALAVSVSEDLEVGCLKRLSIPYDFLMKLSLDKGVYLLVLELPAVDVDVGGLGRFHFKKGYYVYTGSAKRNLRERINRHLRRVKKKHWHIDYITSIAERIVPIPIVTREDIECELAEKLKFMASYAIDGFGSSDCKCVSHLFYFPSNPLSRADFVELVTSYRVGRITKYLEA